jgi:hypothetical protein
MWGELDCVPLLLFFSRSWPDRPRKRRPRVDRSEFHAQESSEEPLRSSTPTSRSWTESGWPQAAAIGCPVFFVRFAKIGSETDFSFLFDLNSIGSEIENLQQLLVSHKAEQQLNANTDQISSR